MSSRNISDAANLWVHIAVARAAVLQAGRVLLIYRVYSPAQPWLTIFHRSTAFLTSRGHKCLPLSGLGRRLGFFKQRVRLQHSRSSCIFIDVFPTYAHLYDVTSVIV